MFLRGAVSARMPKAFLLYIVLSLLTLGLAGQVSGEQNYYFSCFVNIDLFFTDRSESFHLVFLNLGPGNLTEYSFYTCQSPMDISAYDNNGTLNYLVIPSGDKYRVMVKFRKPLAPGNSYSLTVKMQLEEKIVGEGGKLIFERELEEIKSADALRIRLTLPEGTGLVSPIVLGGKNTTAKYNLTSIKPFPSNLFTDGRRIIIEWFLRKPEKPVEIKVVFEKLLKPEPTVNPALNLTMNHSVTGTKQRNSMDFLLPFLTGALISSVAMFIIQRTLPVYRRRKEVGVVREKELIHLSDAERVVVEELLKTGGSLTQRELRKRLKASKSWVSLVVSKLCRKGIVSKEAAGKTNIIKLVTSIRVKEEGAKGNEREG